MSKQFVLSNATKAILEKRLLKIYPEDNIAPTLQKIIERMESHAPDGVPTSPSRWDERDVILITYGDSIISKKRSPLQNLARFMNTYLRGLVSDLHILPFCPYSSDDGFSVIDYRRVNEELGTWEDIAQLRKHFDLMFDLVLNHVSAQSDWFQDYLKGIAPAKEYFIEGDPSQDLSQVIRPRSSKLLTPVETHDGVKHVWTTFSEDQIDLNYANPQLLLEIIDILLFYVQMGARFLRLDAVGFLWKDVQTSCMHLSQTHEIIKLFRDILNAVAPSVVLITETNVPHAENVSYFGDGDEAHLVYQFSLPPLLLHAFNEGNSEYLTQWASQLESPPPHCSFLNFTASHDGIGLRPLEGLLPPNAIETLLDCMKRFGGKISKRKKPDGTSSPYEINISYFDALKGTCEGIDQWQKERFLCSQAIMLAFQGVPAIYLHSLTATPNDQEYVKTTGRARSINRHKWDYSQLNDLLFNPRKINARILHELRWLLNLRKGHAVFHPEAPQEVLKLNSALFGLSRKSIDGSEWMIAINNLTNRPQVISSTMHPLLKTRGTWHERVSDTYLFSYNFEIKMEPYQTLWLFHEL